MKNKVQPEIYIDTELSPDEISIDDIIEGIEKICFEFNCNVDKKTIHKNTLLEIKKFLGENRFNTKLEYSIVFNHVRRKDNKKFRYNGYIDLVGFKDNIKIAIELDTGTHTKYKSIEKLIETKFGILIAIVRGTENKKELIEENINKINLIDNPTYERIHLILMKNKIRTKVN